MLQDIKYTNWEQFYTHKDELSLTVPSALSFFHIKKKKLHILPKKYDSKSCIARTIHNKNVWPHILIFSYEQLEIKTFIINTTYFFSFSKATSHGMMMSYKHKQFLLGQYFVVKRILKLNSVNISLCLFLKDSQKYINSSKLKKLPYYLCISCESHLAYFL